nr:MAG TPA: Major capsid protein [Microviridae sp.]
MSITKTLGGDRIGSGRKMTVQLENFGRASFNIGGIVATDQAAGTIVPYFCDIATNGTTYYIDMATKTRTLPTVGPLFGSFKHQLDWFSIPIRLYIGALHNNALGIGMNMAQIKMPKMDFLVYYNSRTPYTEQFNKKQIAQDSLVAYLGIRGLGRASANGTYRRFPAIFLLAYWDIYKNYYANKQEGVGMMIGPNIADWTEFEANQKIANSSTNYGFNEDVSIRAGDDTFLTVSSGSPASEYSNPNNFEIAKKEGDKIVYVPIEDNPDIDWQINEGNQFTLYFHVDWTFPKGTNVIRKNENRIQIVKFNLSDIDGMRERILATPKTKELIISNEGEGKSWPYHLIYAECQTNNSKFADGVGSYFPQCGLGLRTYLSDRFNNWLSSEWIDGATGVNEISAVDVSDGKLTMDALILAKKVFNMLNRIAVSDGTYNSWQEAVYGVTAVRMAESPIYCGGMSSEIVFDEVVSNSVATNAAGEEEPLGSLAGRGADRGSKGGRSIKIKITEPSMIMCLGSIVPRIFYSEGNKWWTMIDTMNDLHKPSLDAIGFQDLLTEEIAAWSTELTKETNNLGTPTYKAVGKQTSWIEYQTNVNQSFGGFAAGGELDWMVLNRPYHTNKLIKAGEDSKPLIGDATTYIDPQLFNRAFADTKLTAKNFWVQVAFDITARRVMSAKQIPNL